MSKMRIEIRNLVRVYKIGKIEVQALRGANLNIDEGELVAIIGPSGSGKTTLLNVIGALDEATVGSVRVGDLEVTSLSVTQLVDYRRKTVGHIFQTLNLIPTLTAEENIELPMIALGVSRGKRKQRVQELLDVVSLSERAQQ